MEIRSAQPADLPGITAIYNDVLATSTAIYAHTPSTLEARREWVQSRQKSGYPVLVAADRGDVQGFASFGDFRSWPGYRYSCLLYTSPSPRDLSTSRMPSSA